MAIEYVLNKVAPPAGAQIDYRGSLNDEQYAAVTAKPGPILVIAGAGSGKTRTLTYRVAYLIENGVEPENILLLTFTNKSAREMLERVGNLLPSNISRIWGGTFHSVANRLLRRHANTARFQQRLHHPRPRRRGRPRRRRLARNRRRSQGQDAAQGRGAPRHLRPRRQHGEDRSPAWSSRTTPTSSEFLDKLEAAQRVFRDRKVTDNVMDYDDLLVYALRLLQDHEDLRKHYQEQFQHVLVDEYQDTNKIQSDFIDTLAAYHHQVMAVGDDAQSIYSWRGANFENVLTFPERFPNTREVRIETNYRSTPEILALANHAIAANTKQFAKNLHAVRPAEKYLQARAGLPAGRQPAGTVHLPAHRAS